MSNVFMDTHLANKFQVDGVAANRSEVSMATPYALTKMCTETQEYVLCLCCGAGTDVVAALLAGRHVVITALQTCYYPLNNIISLHHTNNRSYHTNKITFLS